MRRQLMQLIQRLIRRIKAWRRLRRIRAASEHIGATADDGIGKVPEARTVEEIRTEGMSELDRAIEHLRSLAKTAEEIDAEAAAYAEALFVEIDARHAQRQRKSDVRLNKTLAARGMTLEQVAPYEHDRAVDEVLDSVEHDLTAFLDRITEEELAARTRWVELTDTQRISRRELAEAGVR